MHATHFVKAGIFAAVLTLIGFTSWELYLRNTGISIDYDDTPAMWASKREQVYLPKEKSTVFIGSSRIKYDLDIDTWKNITGDEPIQLAIEGSSPAPVLQDLADDEKFHGKLVIDVTEILFFSQFPPHLSEPQKNVSYFKDETPSQRFSAMISYAAESELLFLDRWNYCTNAFLDKLEVPSRKGVFVFPVFPLDFGRMTADRQAKMTDRFLADTNLQNKVKQIWKYLGDNNRQPPMSGKPLDEFLLTIKSATDKIKARGGEVIFVRTPSSGPFYMGESQGFPRDKYWDRLLTVTQCKGIHFKDDPATANMQCPEFSHLSPYDAVTYTKSLIHSLQQNGWKLAKQSTL